MTWWYLCVDVWWSHWVINNLFERISWVFLQKIHSIIFQRRNYLFTVYHPVSHETSLDHTVKFASQDPASSDHPRCSWKLRIGATTTDPSLQNVKVQATVHYLVDSFHDFGKGLFTGLVKISNKVRFDFILLLWNNLALTKPFEAVFQFLNNLIEMYIFRSFNTYFALFDIPFYFHIKVVQHLILQIREHSFVVFKC